MSIQSQSPPRKVPRIEGSPGSAKDTVSQFQHRSHALTIAQYGVPNQTIYINNLNDTVSKRDLKINLYMLLSPFGDIISIVALKTPEMRGQAHIAFADVTSATTALQTLQGTLFLGKAMKMAFAKTKSHAIAKLDGTFILGDYGLKTDPPKALNENDSEKDNDTAIAYQMESDEEVTEKEDPIVSGTLKETLGAKRYRQEDN